MVRREQELRGVAEGLVPGEPGRVRMPVRAHDGERANRPVELASDGANCGVGWEKTVGVKGKFSWHIAMVTGVIGAAPPADSHSVGRDSNAAAGRGARATSRQAPE